MVSTIKYSKPQVAMRGKFSKGKLMFLLASFFVVLAISSIYIPVPYLVYGIIISYVFSGIISLVIQIIQEF